MFFASVERRGVPPGPVGRGPADHASLLSGAPLVCGSHRYRHCSRDESKEGVPVYRTRGETNISRSQVGTSTNYLRHERRIKRKGGGGLSTDHLSF